MKSDVWYMRFYVGDKKYKTLSLRTSDKEVARGRALDRWRQLTNHLEQGGEVFEKTTMESLDQYLVHLDELLESQQYKKHTINGKKTSLKKLRLFLEPYRKPSEIPALVLTDYTKWRRTKNWDKSKHRNNHNPPTDQTINKELTDFKGFFDWCKSKKIYVQELNILLEKLIGISLRRRTLHLKLMIGCPSFTTFVLGLEKLKTEKSSGSFIEKSSLSS